MSNVFITIFHFFNKRKLLLWLMLGAVVILCAYGITNINTDEDISSFLPQNEKNERINYAYRHIGAANQIVLGIKCADSASRFNTDIIAEGVDLLIGELSGVDTAHLKSVHYMVDQQQMQAMSSFIIENIPYFLTASDYARIDSLITKEGIYGRMRANKMMLSSPASSLVKDILIADPLGVATPLLQGLQNFQMGKNYQLINDYIFNAAGDEATVILTSKHPTSETSLNATLLAQVQKAIDGAVSQSGGTISVSLFSASAIAITNAQQIKRDSMITVSIALIFITLLLVYFYRNVKSIALILASLIFGGLFAIGIVSCFSTTISIIAVGIGSVIIGIATNYPLHFLAHIRHGYTCEQSIRDISAPLLTGNITTIGAFLSLLFISSSAMHDLGIFASLLLAGTIVFVLIFMPHLFTRSSVSAVNDENLVFKRLASFQPETNRWLVIAVCLLTVVLWFFSGRTSFDTNMQNINYMTPEQRQQLNRFTQMMFDQKQTLYCVAEGSSVDGALQSYELAQGAIDSVLGVLGSIRRMGLGVYVPSAHAQQERLSLWENYWEERRSGVISNISAAAKEMGFRDGTFAQFEAILGKQYQPHGVQHFAPFIDAFGENFIINNPDRAMVLSVLYVDRDKVSTIEDGLNSISSGIFAFDSSSMTQKLVGALSDDFNSVLYICGIIVLVFLTVSFGRAEIALLAFLPLAVGWVWILGIMGITNMQFNIVNIILATFIFGQGDDYTIFVTEGLMYEYTYRKQMLKSYKNTVLLSAFIMFIGIGSLIFAKHPAMKSLGEVTVVGMFCVVLMAYIFPPLVFKWLTYKKGKKRLMPVTLWNMVKTVVAFAVFILGAVLLSIAGFFLITIGGRTDKHKYMYHKLLCATMRQLSKMLFQVNCHVDNRHNETFQKPGVIICNHQSHIDLLYTLMLSPKVVCLTNRWVWNSPFYGWILRYADFLPVIDGIQENVDKLSDLVQRGYSILVFPEGTRSADCSILRFHQGAFFLAKELNIDIIPVITHGTGHVLPKTEFMLRRGRVDVRILSRITPQEFASENRETARQVRAMYQQEYDKLVQEVETTDYFYDLVLHNYIYKGRDVERRARRVLRNSNGFAQQVAQLPMSGSVHIENCGQGEYPLMAALVRKDLLITATDPNPELVELARNCASVPHNLRYV